MNSKVLQVTALSLVSLVAAVAPALAQTPAYPTKPITLVVPYPPGGPNDTIARALGPELAKALAVPVVIENKPGAAGNIGTGHTARAAADGYTIALPGSALSINTVIFDNAPYKISDFRAVGMVAQGPVVAVAHPSLNIKTIAQLVAHANANPGKLSFPSGGKGTSPYLAGELLKNTANIDMVHVPYKGTGEFIPDLLAGRVPVAFVSPLIARQHVDTGALVPLATTGTRRLRGWETLPTVEEAGVAGFRVLPWYAVVVPAATPTPVVNKLNAALQQALASAEIQKKLVDLGLDALPGTADDAQAVVVQEVQLWKNVKLSD
jgi:tripartite-type tricarboxylate transporter receptor subunit TctC